MNFQMRLHSIIGCVGMLIIAHAAKGQTIQFQFTGVANPVSDAYLVLFNSDDQCSAVDPIGTISGGNSSITVPLQADAVSA